MKKILVNLAMLVATVVGATVVLPAMDVQAAQVKGTDASGTSGSTTRVEPATTESSGSENAGNATSIENAINQLPHASSGGISGDFLTNLLYWIYAIGGLVAVVIIIYGGVKYNTAQGDPGKVKQASQIIAFAIVGLVIVILAGVITAFVTGVIGGAAK